MYQEKTHPVPPASVPPHQVEEGDHVGGQANHEHDGVGCDADNLSLSKLHVIWQAEVGIHQKNSEARRFFKN